MNIKNTLDGGFQLLLADVRVLFLHEVAHIIDVSRHAGYNHEFVLKDKSSLGFLFDAGSADAVFLLYMSCLRIDDNEVGVLLVAAKSLTDFPLVENSSLGSNTEGETEFADTVLVIKDDITIGDFGQVKLDIAQLVAAVGLVPGVTGVARYPELVLLAVYDEVGIVVTRLIAVGKEDGLHFLQAIFSCFMSDAVCDDALVAFRTHVQKREGVFLVILYATEIGIVAMDDRLGLKLYLVDALLLFEIKDFNEGIGIMKLEKQVLVAGDTLPGLLGQCKGFLGHERPHLSLQG